ncbi:CAP-Gly domain containing protein [Tritrichomonas foetus]|uniref:CAP-Gly domain containing protein n=1 Tax=Tritrichomonas foetus TaxID=1144522 RepID=A0A1J4KEL4_9EUKA|nr:CAP-Gly domain containing protein [Tritrichomonas foetus]|eukprot:OHT09887.1 CAP-Gly domain containing protein [Tritrichomonas foetus]
MLEKDSSIIGRTISERLIIIHLKVFFIDFLMYRIRAADGSAATVRWEGILQDAKGNDGEWLGVEWDNPERGKHNGEYKGQKLFEVTKPNSGSFVRKAAAKKGLVLADMLSEYRGANGFLSLDNTDLETVGSVSDFPSHVRTVNASHTLVGSFQFIWDILDVAPFIETLILGQTHFYAFPPATKTYDLKEIVVNHTNLNEEHIKILFQAFPKLEKIDISYCSLPPLSIFSNVNSLKDIHLDGLKITDFNDVSQNLGKLPNLEILSLCNNELTKVEYLPNTFLSLTTIMIKSNKIEDVFSIDGLLKFPKLEDLSLQRNPFQEKTGEIEARMITVVRFPHLKKLNGSQIAPSELYQSEIQYLEFYAKDVAANGSAKHQRWDELVKKFGEPAMPVEKPVTQKKKATIKFVYGDQTITKTIPLSMKIGLLSSRIPKLFKVQEPELELAIETGNYKAYLSYPEQTLAEVGCTDESIIYAGKPGEHLIDETQQAISFKLRSISAHIETNDE